MKNQIKLSAIIFAAIFFIFSCEKENATSPSSGSTKKQSALTDLFKNIAPPMQTFTINAGQYQIITGQKGTRITFFSNSFKKKDGTILTSGNIKIVLQEMLTGPEMILANKTTTSDGKLLVSGGQIFIKAYLGSEELLVNKAAKPQVDILATTTDNMNLFTGSLIPNDTIVGDTAINWVQDTTTVRRRQDTMGIAFNFDLDSFRYINCDYFYKQSVPLTDIKVSVPLDYNDTNMTLVLFFPSINSVVKANVYDKFSNTISLGGGNNVPIGLPAKILFIGRKGTQFYYEIKSATITNKYSTSMSPTSANEAQIQAAIKSM